MAKTIYCAQCHTHVGKVEKGSLLKKGISFLCAGCEAKRKAAELYFKNSGKRPGPGIPDFPDIFGDFFGKSH
jgi:predicted CXXCH cytochrome family protein